MGWIALLIVAAGLALVIRLGFKHNRVDWGNAAVNCIDGLSRLYCHRYHRLHGERINLPKSGGALVVSNHMTGLDPLLLIAACDRPLRFIIAKEEYERPILNRLFKLVGCVPVDRGGRSDAAFRTAARLLRAGEVVALFPHGKIHLDSERSSRIKPGAIKLSRLGEAPIFPVRIVGLRGQGRVFPGLILRATAHLQTFEAIAPELAEKPELKEALGELLLGRRPSLEIG